MEHPSREKVKTRLKAIVAVAARIDTTTRPVIPIRPHGLIGTSLISAYTAVAGDAKL